MNEEYFFSELPEKRYLQKISYEHRKKLGQFFTPMFIADLMGSWVVNNNSGKKILDPAIGLGIFIRSITKEYGKNNDFQFFGYEIDPEMIEKTKNLFQDSGTNIEFHNQDFLDDWENKYDGIICNPPYLKFHNYNNKDLILNFRTKLKQNFSGLTNIYTLFILKSLKQLKKGGRAAFIVPSEFMNADYGKEIKKYLIESKMLRFVIIVEFNVGVFEGATTTSSILLFANDENDNDVQFIDVNNIDDFNFNKSRLFFYPNQGKIGKIKKITELDETKKWRSYYKEVNGEKYKNLVPFSNYAKVMRGIATGANKYFTFSEVEARKYGINNKYLLPCLTKANQIKKSFFENSDFEKLKKAGKPIYLLNATNQDDPNLKRYLEKGEKEGINERYLTKNRDPWYSLENRPPAPILVKVFNKKDLNFMRNYANVYNLTAFHCVYVKPNAESKIDILMAYLLTDVAKDIFEDNMREYGDGLKKYEPNDLNNGLVIDLEIIPSNQKNEILKLLEKFKKLESYNKDTSMVKKELNDIFLTLLNN